MVSSAVMNRQYRTKIGGAARRSCYSGKKRTEAFGKNKDTWRSHTMVAMRLQCVEKIAIENLFPLSNITAVVGRLGHHSLA